MDANKAPAIGIDLGTVNSCVAVYQKGRVDVIANEVGDRTTPSFVYYNPDDVNDVVVGKSADNLHIQNYKNGIFDVKRLMGRKFHELTDIKKDYFPFKLVPGENENVEIEINSVDGIIRKKPEEVSAEILKKLKNIASQYLGQEVTDAVITVPAYFNNFQREATKKAGELAGLNVLKLLNEPTAAALFYTQEKAKQNKILLVFDLGGGTFDVSIVEINDKQITVKAVCGDTFLGGRDFDHELAKHIINKYQGTSPSTKTASYRNQRRLQATAEYLKKLLSTQDSVSDDMFFYTDHNENDLIITIERDDFEEINKEHFQRTLAVVETCLNEAGLSKTDVDEVVLVGGSTRIPKIQNILSDYFHEKLLKKDLNPDEAVAAGAAIQAHILSERSQDDDNYFVVDVTPLSIGDELWGGLMKVIIERNTPIPTSRTVYSVTTKNNQETCEFSIYEGERKQVKYNQLLGEFKITGLPPGPAGQIEFEKTLRLNEDGILEVIVTESSTEKMEKLSVTLNNYKNTGRCIKNSVEEAFVHKLEDDKFENFVLHMGKLRKYCHNLIYDCVEKKMPKNDLEIVQTHCNHVLDMIRHVIGKDIEVSLMEEEVKKLDQQFKTSIRELESIINSYSLVNFKFNSSQF